MSKPEAAGPDDAVQGLAWMAAGAVMVAALAWLLPCAIVLVHAREVPRLGVFDAVASLGRLVGKGRTGDPASAYPAPVAAEMPGAGWWWLTAAILAGSALGLVCVAVRRIEPSIARERLGRRAYDWRGARPRAWARPRDLRRRRGEKTGFSIGRLDGRPVATDEEAHIVVIAPTRAGKTTRCVIPWLLEHEGPALVTSTKRDVLDATREHRERLGPVWVFDPFGADTVNWSPIEGCGSWSHALRQAQWLADASADGDSEIARYWRGEAAKLMAPLLHAAALADLPVTEVLAWLDTQDAKRPAVVLHAAGADAAARQLAAVAGLDSRNKGTTYMSAGSVLSAYRYPEVARSTGPGFTADDLVRSAAGTLFLVAAERHQNLLAPLLVSIASSVVYEAVETDAFTSPDRRLRLLLDEAANVAPLRDLPRMLSQGAGHGIRIASVWQSVAQLRERYGTGADTILANSTAKLLMGPITDHATRSFVTELLGDQAERPQGLSGDRRRTALTRSAALQQMVGDRAVLLSGGQAPAMVTLQPFWRRR